MAPPSAVAPLEALADEVVCLATPEPFLAVGRFYDDFDPTSDEEVRALLALAARLRNREGHGRDGRREVEYEKESAMKNRQVPHAEWPRFFEGFTRRHQGWLATVRVVDERLGAQVEARDLPLEGIVVDAESRGAHLDPARPVRREPTSSTPSNGPSRSGSR